MVFGCECCDFSWGVIVIDCGFVERFRSMYTVGFATLVGWVGVVGCGGWMCKGCLFCVYCLLIICFG